MTTQVIPPEIVKKYNINLLKSKSLMDYLKTKRGLTKDTIIEYELGYDFKDKRFTIPIKGLTSGYFNIRKYNPNDKEYKMISYGKGYGEARLFPTENLKKKDKGLIICEGELDCLMLNQMRFPAICGTCGVATWKEEWSSQLKGINVSVIFDCDEPGRKGAESIVKKLVDVVNNIKVIDLGLEDGEDVTDFFVKHKKEAKDLVKIIKDTEPEDLHEFIDLSASMDSKYYDKKIKFNGIVIGKDLSPYLIPKKVEAGCLSKSRKKEGCEFCNLNKEGKVIKLFNYDDDKEIILHMINCTDDQVIGAIKRSMKIPLSSGCRENYIKIIDRQNVEDIKMIAELEFEKFDRIDKDYAIRKCLIMGVNIQTNQSYLCKGTTLADPSNQMGVHLIKDIKGSKDNISRFILNEEVKENLKLFQPKDQNDEFAIWEKLKDIYNDLMYNVTKMYGRENIIMGTDLVFHSPLYFKYLGDMTNKGWLEMTVIGDTKCGKTETIKSLHKHFRAGEFLTSGENTTRAGLLGGAQQTHSGRWTLTWGKLPVNDRGLVTIDEADELHKNGTLPLLSGVRSSGKAELIKIQSQRTNARTRIIFIANPLHGKVNQYNFGVEAIKELFGTQQDISRIDLAICVSRDDITQEKIMELQKEKYEHKYTSDICHQGVMFAWSRRPEHIIFAKGTEDLILDMALSFGKKYSSDIPLIIDAEIGLKIARMAVALAIRLYSTDKTGENVIVYPAHVLTIAKFLQDNYDNNVMGYADYSEQKKKSNKLKDEATLDKRIDDKEIIEMLLETDKIRLTDIEDIFIEDMSGAKKIVAEFRKVRALKRTHTYYIKTPAFIKYLKYKKEQFKEEF
jgi:5S rRNA maturation endonuclease (ribonuclease M5)